ncbi:MAG: prolipoprotein diacylglyceryl transferase, partial [Sandaracinaceae bacterium]|nr:prolipoprotein diacylglyceryl transferase [Sandaracinaceae bacterium]
VFYEPSGLADTTRVFALGSGSASHGAFLGALVTFYLGTRTSPEGPWAHLDLAMSGAVALIPLWRLGNLLNSEIVGTRWDGPWAFVFVRHDCFDVARDACTAPPRHPTVLYEALLGAGLVALAAWLQHVWRPRLRPGVIFAILLSATFAGRMLVELTREREDVDAGWPVTMGFLLSVPFAFAGAGLLIAWRGRLRIDTSAASQ